MTKSKIVSYSINLAAALAVYLVFHFLFSSRIVSRTLIDIFTLCCDIATAAVSLNHSTGLLGELNLGHAGFMSVGAYTAALITLSAGRSGNVGVLLLSLLAGGLTATLSALVIGIPVLRLRGDYLAITTLAFGEIVKVLMRSMKITGGGQPLTGIALDTSYTVGY